MSEEHDQHTEEMQDIITSPPAWLLSWGTTVYLSILILVIGLSAFIRYPNIVHAQLVIKTPNAPPPVVSKIPGRLVKILVKQNQQVENGQVLAYMESTGDHEKILALLDNLKALKKQIIRHLPLNNTYFDRIDNIDFGELQQNYSTFFQQYVAYKSENRDQSVKQVIRQAGFLQVISNLINHVEEWKRQYVLSASEKGRLFYIGLLQANQQLKTGQEVFYIEPGDTNFFGEIDILQGNIGKIKVGQKVLIKLKSFPYEEYGILTGTMNYIPEVTYRDSIYVSKVNINRARPAGLKSVKIKNGMRADAEIITDDVSLLTRLTKNITISMR